MTSPNENSRTIRGRLIAFAETGTEGVFWALQEDGKQGYDGLHILEKGDVLRVFNDAARQQKVWEGRIDYNYDRNRRAPYGQPHLRRQWLLRVGAVHGLQKGILPVRWAAMFTAEKPAELVRAPSPEGPPVRP